MALQTPAERGLRVVAHYYGNIGKQDGTRMWRLLSNGECHEWRFGVGWIDPHPPHCAELRGAH